MYEGGSLQSSEAGGTRPTIDRRSGLKSSVNIQNLFPASVQSEAEVAKKICSICIS